MTDSPGDSVYAPQVTCRGRQPRARLGAGILLLIEWLAFDPATEIRMQRPPLRRGPVQGTAVPEVTVEDDDSAGRR